MPGASSRHRRLFGGLLALGLVAILIGYAAGPGLGDPSIPGGDVALVEDAPDGNISQEELDRAIEQTAQRNTLQETPKPGSPEYDAVRDSALTDLILARWIRGEADEQGISVSDTEVDDSLAQLKKQQFGGAKGFQKFLDSQGFSLQEARDRIELQLLNDSIQQKVVPQNPPVSEDEIDTFYQSNLAQFEQPEARDVYLILNKDEAKATAAKAALGTGPTAADWKRASAKYSTDQATKDSGGLRKGVVSGQSEPTLDDEIFSAEQGVVVGPFKSESGYYVIQVTSVTPAETTPLDKVAEQIRQQLVSVKQQEISADYQTDIVAKWTSRTFCADGFATIDLCDNFEAPVTACPEKTAEEQGCPAPVASTRPVAPGSATVFGTPAGLPQGPQSAAPATPTIQIPSGAAPTP